MVDESIRMLILFQMPRSGLRNQRREKEREADGNLPITGNASNERSENAAPQEVPPSEAGGDGNLRVTLSEERVAELARKNAELQKKPFSIFHAHFAGVQQYPFEMLKIFVSSERKVVAGWSDQVQTENHEALLKAIPEMSLVLGKEKWPEPVGFSAEQARDTYLSFLDFFLDNYGIPPPVFQSDESKAADVESKLDAADVVPPVVVPPADASVVVPPADAQPSKKDEHKRKRERKKKKEKRKKMQSSSSEKDESSPSSSPSSSSEYTVSSTSSSSSSSESESDSSDDSSSRKKRKKKSRKRRKSKSRKRKRKSSSSKKKRKRSKKVSFVERVKAVESSQRVGAKKYSREHLFACQEVVQAYKSWSNPKRREDQKATIPVRVREFIQRHLADPDSNILKIYDAQHVKKNANERKHVTFLLNKMGKLASKVATARLERAQKALDKHNRIIEGAKMSKKARAESIKRECDWAGKIRWFSEIIAEGERSYYLAKSALEERKRVDNFRRAHPDVSESVAKKIIKGFGEQSTSSKGGTSGRQGVRVSGGRENDQAKMINSLKSQLGQLLKKQRANAGGTGGGAGGGGDDKVKKFKFACWHCGSKNHPVALCPVAAAGKPPTKGSYFFKQRGGGDKNKDKDKQ